MWLTSFFDESRCVDDGHQSQDDEDWKRHGGAAAAASVIHREFVDDARQFFNHFLLCDDRWRITPRAMRSRQADPSRRIILTLPTLIQFSQVLLISFNFFPFRTLFHHIRRWHLRHTFFFLFNYTRTYKIKKKKLKFKRRALGRDVLTARRLHWEWGPLPGRAAVPSPCVL